MRSENTKTIRFTVGLTDDLYHRLLNERIRQMGIRHKNVSRQVVLVELIEEALNRRDGKPE